jgi:hypothetical protein
MAIEMTIERNYISSFSIETHNDFRFSFWGDFLYVILMTNYEIVHCVDVLQWVI